ncbi:MAG: hypothetical protein Q8J68_07800 [Methanolobus sp.]|uniref:hypothetical protein n=1 Tax=Methanolobus sp. TaxID=1874737 RepID=UPI0027307FAC|nr:hypothetical protein [Methanolobus sp.]MDP2217171.1 hypothetical protein [Methanolobus sp.]
MKTKSIKIPIELIEYLEKHNDGRPPGEVLLDIVKDYQRIERAAAIIAPGKLTGTNAAEIFADYLIEYNNKITGIEASIKELGTMVQGLKLFFEKVK